MQKKRVLSLLLTLAALALLMPGASALEAADISAGASIKRGKNDTSYRYMFDRLLDTIWTSPKSKAPFVEVTTDTPCYGVGVTFGNAALSPWTVQENVDGKWVDVASGEGLYGSEYAEIPGLTHFRIAYPRGDARYLKITELYLFGQGDAPDTLQRWQPTVQKADLMVLAAHPDDELIWLGGMLPTYAGEKKLDTVVCYMTCKNAIRRSELLGGLWYCGVRTYPDIGDFPDEKIMNLRGVYNLWKEDKVNAYIVALIRKYKPEVIVSHDIGGEYGHGAHRVCADALPQCVLDAADPAKFPDSAALYGVWQTKKLYLHLFKEKQITLDWDIPLASQNGLTGFETAQNAYMLHNSQYRLGRYFVQHRDDPYSSYDFGLVYSAVGEDVQKDDLFENIAR